MSPPAGQAVRCQDAGSWWCAMKKTSWRRAQPPTVIGRLEYTKFFFSITCRNLKKYCRILTWTLSAKLIIYNTHSLILSALCLCISTLYQSSSLTLPLSWPGGWSPRPVAGRVSIKALLCSKAHGWSQLLKNFLNTARPSEHAGLVGLGVWFSLRVREVPGSNPGRAPYLLLIYSG